VAKNVFGFLGLAKIGCLGLLAGLSHSFRSMLFCYTLSYVRWTQCSHT